MMDGDRAGLLHPVREHGVSSRGEDGDSGQHKVFAKVHGRLSRLFFKFLNHRGAQAQSNQQQKRRQTAKTENRKQRKVFPASVVKSPWLRP
jgi:hypothetical protein